MNFLRHCLQTAFALIVLPQPFARGQAGTAFDPAGVLKDARATAWLAGVLGTLEALAGALAAARTNPAP